MKNRWMKTAGGLLLVLCVLLCLLGCGAKAVPFKTGSYMDLSERCHYHFLEDGKVETSMIGHFFRGTYEAKDGKITIRMDTSKGIEVQTGSYEGEKISLDAGGELPPIVLTWDPEANH